MRKWTRMLLLGALFAVVLCTSALAVDNTAKGIHTLTETDSALSLTAKTADGTPVAVTTEAKDGTQVYNGTEQVGMTYMGVTSGECLVFVLSDDSGVPKESNIAYIDQVTATTSGVSFDLYPSSLTSGKTYNIYVSGTAKELEQVGAFGYYAPYKLGDINSDNKYNAVDVRAVLQMSVKVGTWTETQRLAADVNVDSKINAIDVKDVLQASVKLPTKYI